MATAIPIFEKKNFLVTGGAGFLGSHMCERLLSQGKVICIDNLVSGSVENIAHLLSHPDFAYVRHDVSVPFTLDQFPELEKFQVQYQGVQEVYHFACPTSPKDFEQYKIDTLKATSVGLINVLEIARAFSARCFLASSSVVYGEIGNSDGLAHEDSLGVLNHVSARGCYDEGKKFSETVATTYAQVYGLDVRIARIFRTYGPRVRLGAGEMMPDFITNALDGHDLVIYGDEQFSTSLCYVSDMIDGIVALMSHPEVSGPVNLGSDVRVKLSDVAQMIIEMTQSSSQVVYEDPLLFMSPLPLPSLQKARSLLEWFPIVGIKTGLERMIEYTTARAKLLG